MADSDFVDYYELLQISPSGEVETIHRVYKMLATRYDSDNTETGDLARFLLLNQPYETPADAGLRSSYNAVYEEHKNLPIGLFQTKELSIGGDGEANRRMGILCLLYNRPRSNPDSGLSLLEFKAKMLFAREHLLLPICYGEEQGLLRSDEYSDFVITGPGIDNVETHLPSNRLLYRLLKTAESEGADASLRKERAASEDGS